MSKLRLASLAVTGAVVLSACADDPTRPAAPNTDPSLSTLSAENTGSQLVVFASKSIPAGFAERVAALGGTVEQALNPIGVAFVSGLDEAGIQALSADGSISFMEAETVLPLADPVFSTELAEAVPTSATKPQEASYYSFQWNMGQIGAPKAWAAGKLGSSSVTVGIIDTGLDYTNPDLVGLVDIGRSRSFLRAEDAVVAKYLPAGTHPMFDLQGHGTHVGGTVSSNGVITAGITSRVKLVGLKVCGSGISGLTTSGCPSSATFAAIVYAADNGIDVVNMSLGGLFTRRGAGGYEETIHRVFNYAKEKKLTIVVSAGNSNVDLDRGLVPTATADGTKLVEYPSLYATYCAATHTICVSATGPTGFKSNIVNGVEYGIYYGPFYNIDARATYSNYGRDGIDVAAPGGTSNGYIWAACPTMRVRRVSAPGVTPAVYEGSAYSYCTRAPTGKGGTSMAAPHVTGLAALMVEKYGRSPDKIAEAITKSSDDLGEAGNDPYYGKGRINMARALGL